MPSTQAYSVSWDVEIQPEGDVSSDVAEITAIRQSDVDSATVKLDTSESPHALEEDRPISIEISDGNDTIQFNGKTDSVKDHATRPMVTVDARSTSGWLDDLTAAGSYSEPTVFQVVDSLIDERPGKVDAITFDPEAHEDRHGQIFSTIDFGSLYYNYNYDPDQPTGSIRFDQHETADEAHEIEIRWEEYLNDSFTTYTANFIGLDANGDEVTASLDLPPGDSAQDAYGTDTVKMPLSGGQGMAVEMYGFESNAPLDEGTEFNPDHEFHLQGNVYNYVKTDWNFRLNQLSSTREAIQSIVSYISSWDDDATWGFEVNDSDELKISPRSELGNQSSSTHVFREGDNVLKPVANRDLDGVRNMIKVQGAGSISAYTWAYDGSFYWKYSDPFEDDPFSGQYPGSAATFDDSPLGGVNDIDNIGLRAEALSSSEINSFYQAFELAKRALREYYQTPVSGKAPMAGIKDIDVGDDAEVYYPSRGIPAKVQSNIFEVKQVEYSVTPQEATTTVDFGSKERNLGDVIGSGGNMARTDVSDSITDISQSFRDSQGGGGSSGQFPVVGTLESQNNDGTWTVTGENGETYENVRVI